MSEERINVRADKDLKEEIKEVSEKTGLSESIIVREGVKEKLLNLKRTHPAYAGDVEVAAA